MSSNFHSSLFVFLTGASGAGKTYLAQALEQHLNPSFVQVEYFDRIGIPTFEEMRHAYGSIERWQEVNTQ